MKKLLFLICFIPAITFAQEKKQAYNLKDFNFYFNGNWQNDTAKSEGMGVGIREYQMILDNTFLQVSNKADNLSKDGKSMVCYHRDLGIFGFDKTRKKITYREFTSEKFYSQYVLDSISEDKKIFVFHSEAFENVPPGYKGRITITVLTDKTFIEHFELAEAGKEFQTYVKAFWIKK